MNAERRLSLLWHSLDVLVVMILLQVLDGPKTQPLQVALTALVVVTAVGWLWSWTHRKGTKPA